MKLYSSKYDKKISELISFVKDNKRSPLINSDIISEKNISKWLSQEMANYGSMNEYRKKKFLSMIKEIYTL